METRTYTGYVTLVLADGTVRKYAVQKKYKVGAGHVRITDEMRERILAEHRLGVPATRIAANLGIGVSRVRRVIMGRECAISERDEKNK